MLKKGSIVLSIWCGINFILAFTILCYVIVLQKDSPILQVASFSEAEIASLGAKTIAALNCFTILYNSCSLVISVLTWPLIRKNLIAGQKSAFWMLVFVIGFIEVMAFFASSYIGHGRWQVNVVQSILYVVGIGLCSYPILKLKTDCMIKQQNPAIPYGSSGLNSWRFGAAFLGGTSPYTQFYPPAPPLETKQARPGPVSLPIPEHLSPRNPGSALSQLSE